MALIIMTLSIMALIIMTLSIMTLGIMTLGIMTLCITTLIIMTLDTECTDFIAILCYSECRYADRHYAECRDTIFMTQTGPHPEGEGSVQFTSLY